MNQGDLGGYYVDARGRVYQLVTFSEQPTASFHQIGGPHELSGVVGSPMLAELKPATVDQIGQEMKRLLGHQKRESPPVSPASETSSTEGGPP